MPIDFSIDGAVAQLRERVADFVGDVVVPAEARDLPGHGLADELRSELQDAARAAGLFAPHVAPRTRRPRARHARPGASCFEEAGYSLLGPQALNCAAPDEGNMHLLDRVADRRAARALPARRSRPASIALVLCHDRAARPGAGSDPAMLHDRGPRGRRRLVDQRPQVVHHRRRRRGVHDLHGAHRRAIAGGRGATMFLVDADNPGMRVERVDRRDRPQLPRAAMPRWCSRTAGSATTRSWARSARASGMPRSGSRRHG